MKAKPAAASRSNQSKIEVGSVVPDFTAASSSGHDVKLSSLQGQKVILYFYPKDDTPGCTLEGQEFTKLHSQFTALNTVVFGVSRDSVASHCKFIDKYGYSFELLSDENENLCQIFDVIKEKNMYGKISMGIERSTFVINEQGKLLAEFRKVQAAGHAEMMLHFIKEVSV